MASRTFTMSEAPERFEFHVGDRVARRDSAGDADLHSIIIWCRGRWHMDRGPGWGLIRRCLFRETRRWTVLSCAWVLWARTGDAGQESWSLVGAFGGENICRIRAWEYKQKADPAWSCVPATVDPRGPKGK